MSDVVYVSKLRIVRRQGPLCICGPGRRIPASEMPELGSTYAGEVGDKLEKLAEFTAAEQTGLSIDTIRFYQKIGLVKQPAVVPEQEGRDQRSGWEKVSARQRIGELRTGP